jgi:hypothetical protein
METAVFSFSDLAIAAEEKRVEVGSYPCARLLSSKYSMKNSKPCIMKYSPTIHGSKSLKTMTSMPKTIAIKAIIGLDTVTPIFPSPFSTSRVIKFSSTIVSCSYYLKLNSCSRMEQQESGNAYSNSVMLCWKM